MTLPDLLFDALILKNTTAATANLAMPPSRLLPPADDALETGLEATEWFVDSQTADFVDTLFGR